MNAATKTKLTSTTQADLTSGNACWETPPAVFAKLQEDFGPFDVDLTANGHRSLCDMWFGPDSSVDEPDALKAHWADYGVNGFSNPPYGRFIGKILKHAVLQREHGFQSTLLLPMRVTKAFKTHILGGADRLLFCDKRLCFFEDGVPRLNKVQLEKHGRAVSDPAVFDSIIVRYDPRIVQRQLTVGIWNVPKHVFQQDLDQAVARIGDNID